MRSEQVSIEDFDLLDPEIQQCPIPHYARMREESPVHRANLGGMGGSGYLITRHEDVSDVLLNHEVFSSRFGDSELIRDEIEEKIEALRSEMGALPRASTMLSEDPPEQTRYRRLVSKAFSAQSISKLEPAIREIACQLIDTWIDDGSVEFVSHFANKLPVRAIALALNIPEAMAPTFKNWSDAAAASIGAALPEEGRLEATRANVQMQLYFVEQLEKRQTNPEDDLLTRLLNARIDRDDDPNIPDKPLTYPEITSILEQLLIAGNETTTNLLSEMMRLLGNHQEEWAALKADPRRVKLVIEEALRLSTPTQGISRLLKTNTSVAGCELQANTAVIPMFASANRDARVFSNPDDFNPDRQNLKEHLAFGKGVHFCLGASLARLEATVALEELMKRIDSFTLSPSNTFEYFPSFVLRGLRSLHIEFNKV